MTDERFDEVLEEMRAERAPAGQAAEAKARAWGQILRSTSLACAEFRPEFGAYRAGELTAARKTLMEDHLGRCADCRRVFEEPVRESRVVAMTPEARRGSSRWMRYAAAACVAAAGLYVGRDRIDSALAPEGPRASVASVSGVLQRVTGESVRVGDGLTEAEIVRTAAGSRAVLRLADGTRVELNQRTELALRGAWSGSTIQLHHGDVIVQAAKQRRGHLRVVTRDSVASVKGTIFAVSAGAAGSLVSVVEGAVDVTQPGRRAQLTAGQQAASTQALSGVPVQATFAWSQEAERYFGLLAEFAGIEKQLAALPGPGLRTEARLLRYLPPDAGVYFAIPNAGGTLREAMRLIGNRAEENEALAEWWRSEQGRRLRAVVDQLQSVTPLLGDEVLVTLSRAGGGDGDDAVAPLLLAEVQPGREGRLGEALDRLGPEFEGKLSYRIENGLLLMAESVERLRRFRSVLGAGAGSPFAAEIAGHYREGAGWLLGMDVAVFARGAGAPEAGVLGMENLRYVFSEQRAEKGQEENAATFSFAGPRRGLASWLAAPGTEASAEYVSSGAVAALALSVRDPRQTIEEIFSSVTGIPADLARFEAETGVNVSTEIAGSLGADFTLAVERPSLPIPGWIAAIEVVHPVVLDGALRRIVDAYNARLTGAPGAPRMMLKQEEVNGRRWTVLEAGAVPAALYWTYDRGYLIASTDRALAARAISTRGTSGSLTRSLKFTERYPNTGSLHHSGFLWLNANDVVADLSSLAANPRLKALMENRDPLLIILDGERERIRAASRSRFTSLVLDAMLMQGAGEAGRGGEGRGATKKLKSRL